MGQTCLAFQMLDMDLFELLKAHNFEPLMVNVIRPITAQLLVAVDALRSLAILHTDIKPDNVMLVSTPDQSLRVKLIDFGLAIPSSQIHPGVKIQPLGYRAPEVALGLPFTEAVDVWGVGCTLAFLYLVGNLFPGSCPYQTMKSVVKLLGQPEEHMLRAGKYTRDYFKEEETADGARWRLMTPETDPCAESQQLHSFSELLVSLDDLLDIYPSEELAEYEDRKVFVELLKQLLHLDGDERISPGEALQHPFVTMSQLTNQPDGRNYRINSKILMSSCSVKTSGDKVDAADPPSGTRDAPPSSSSVDGSMSARCCDEKALSLSHEEPSASSSVGVSAADISISVSSAGSKTLRRRIQRFFSRIQTAFSCCWRPAVDE